MTSTAPSKNNDGSLASGNSPASTKKSFEDTIYGYIGSRLSSQIEHTTSSSLSPEQRNDLLNTPDAIARVTVLIELLRNDLLNDIEWQKGTRKSSDSKKMDKAMLNAVEVAFQDNDCLGLVVPLIEHLVNKAKEANTRFCKIIHLEWQLLLNSFATVRPNINWDYVRKTGGTQLSCSKDMNPAAIVAQIMCKRGEGTTVMKPARDLTASVLSFAMYPSGRGDVQVEIDQSARESLAERFGSNDALIYSLREYDEAYKEMAHGDEARFNNRLARELRPAFKAIQDKA